MTPLIKLFHCRHCTVVKSHPGTYLLSSLGAGLWHPLGSIPTHLSLTGALLSHPKLDQKKKKFLRKDPLWTETQSGAPKGFCIRARKELGVPVCLWCPLLGKVGVQGNVDTDSPGSSGSGL